MAGDIKNFVYTDDFGVRYKVRLDAGNAQQMGFPNPAANEQLPPLPSRFRMRTANFISPSGLVKRTLPAPSRDSIKLRSGATVQLPLYNEGSQQTVAFTIQGRKGERATYT